MLKWVGARGTLRILAVVGLLSPILKLLDILRLSWLWVLAPLWLLGAWFVLVGLAIAVVIAFDVLVRQPPETPWWPVLTVVPGGGAEPAPHAADPPRHDTRTEETEEEGEELIRA